MKKILVMDSGSFRIVGGAANATYPIYNFLKESGYQVDLFADFSNIDKSAKSVDSKSLSLAQYDAVMMNSIRDVGFVMKHLMKGPSKNAKYVYVDRGNVLLNFKNAGAKRLLPKMIARQHFVNQMRKWLDCYVALSAEQYKYARGFFTERTQLTYLPINSARAFRKIKGKKRSEVAIYVGRLDERQKKVGRLIRGVERSVALHPELADRELLAIVGAGPNEKEYKEYVETHGLSGNVGFIGHVDEKHLVRLYNSAGFFVSYSEWEGMSRTFVEAMACGLPMLVNQRNNTIIGYKPETRIVEDEYNGLVFDYYDEGDFAEKFYKMFSEESLRRRLAKNALAVADSFDSDQILQGFGELFDRLLRGRSVRGIVFKQ